MLVTVDTSKHHLLGIRELLPHYIRCLLKNWMEHLTEPTPTGGQMGEWCQVKGLYIISK